MRVVYKLLLSILAIYLGTAIYADDSSKITVNVKGESIVVNDINVYFGEAQGEEQRRQMYSKAHKEAISRYARKNLGYCAFSAEKIKNTYTNALKDFRAKLRPIFLEVIPEQSMSFDAQLVQDILEIADNCTGLRHPYEKGVIFLASDLYRNGWGVDVNPIKASELEYKAAVAKFYRRLNDKVELFTRMAVAKSLQKPNNGVESYVLTVSDPESYCKGGNITKTYFKSAEQGFSQARQERIPFIRRQTQENSVFILEGIAACESTHGSVNAGAYLALLRNWQDGAFMSNRDHEALNWAKQALSVENSAKDQKLELSEIEAKIYLYSKIKEINDKSKARELFESLLENSPRANYYLGEIYYMGWGVFQDVPRARKFFEGADADGSLSAFLHLRRMSADVEIWYSSDFLVGFGRKIKPQEFIESVRNVMLDSPISTSTLALLIRLIKIPTVNNKSKASVKWEKKAACGHYNLAQIQMALSLKKLSDPKWSDWYHIARLNPRNSVDISEKIHRFGKLSSVANKHAKSTTYEKLLAHQCEGQSTG